MTLDELNIWIKSHRYVTNEENDYDSNGNHHETRIYEACMRDGKFFAIEFCNGHPYEKWDKTLGKYGGGFVRGEYEYPRQVFKKTRVEEYYDYDP